jgi:hypothetical protein
MCAQTTPDCKASYIKPEKNKKIKVIDNKPLIPIIKLEEVQTNIKPVKEKKKSKYKLQVEAIHKAMEEEKNKDPFNLKASETFFNVFKADKIKELEMQKRDKLIDAKSYSQLKGNTERLIKNTFPKIIKENFLKELNYKGKLTDNPETITNFYKTYDELKPIYKKFKNIKYTFEDVKDYFINLK